MNHAIPFNKYVFGLIAKMSRFIYMFKNIGAFLFKMLDYKAFFTYLCAFFRR